MRCAPIFADAEVDFQGNRQAILPPDRFQFLLHHQLAHLLKISLGSVMPPHRGCHEFPSSGSELIQLGLHILGVRKHLDDFVLKPFRLLGLRRERTFGDGEHESEATVPLYEQNRANAKRPLGSGIGRPSSLAVSIHFRMMVSTLASASWYVAPSAAQPANSGTSAMKA